MGMAALPGVAVSAVAVGGVSQLVIRRHFPLPGLMVSFVIAR